MVWKTHLCCNVSRHNNRRATFFVGSCQGVRSGMKFGALFNWEEAAIQRGLEHGSRGKGIVGAVNRQLLVKILQAGEKT
jgi:hypothetical protein